MVAIDQRESLRRMFPLLDGQEVDDGALRRFKREATTALSPYASAVLLDRCYGVDRSRPAGLAEGTALILAADDLTQPAGQPVVSSRLDPLVTVDYVQQVGAEAIKLLVIWYEDGPAAEREDLVRSFVQLADAAGVVSLVEGVVHPSVGAEWADMGRRHDAIIRAAVELSSYGGAIYKAEVPGYVPGDLSLVREQARQLTDMIDVPWVVLSSGVALAEFPGAVAEAVAGGASGFLAGRAIWSDTVVAEHPAQALAELAVPRLRSLRDIVSDAFAYGSRRCGTESGE